MRGKQSITFFRKTRNRIMIKAIKSRIKHLILRSIGRVSHLKIGVKCEQAWYGNKYGGFYICDKYINEKSIIYSFGIGEDISFDETVITGIWI